MKARTLLIAVSLLAISPSALALGIDTTLRGSKPEARSCALMAARHVPSEVSGAQQDQSKPANTRLRYAPAQSASN